MPVRTPPEQRPFRFGLAIGTDEASRSGLLELADRAEDAGIEVLLGSDHLGRWGSLPMLQAVAQHTGLRIGTLVLNNDLRHPAVLVQELTTIDLVTDGRLEIGIGAGWNRPEYEAAGLPFDPPRERIARMRATVAMLKSAMRDGAIEHPGDEAYPAIRQQGLPTSVQRPHPPILVGGGGPRILAYAAREATIVGLDPRSLPDGGHDPWDVTEAAIDRKVGWIREAAGDRWGELELNIVITAVNPAAEHGRDIGPEELARSPHFLAGDAERIADTLLARRERWGISYIVIGRSEVELMRPVITRLAGR
jgi:probable F420-dependent oxidoreductase